MTITEPAEKVTRRDLAEGRIDKVISDRTELVPISRDFGGLRFDNAMQVAEAAKLMATAGPLLPPWLQGNVGGCWGIIIRANELNISPMALANWSYVVSNRGVDRVAFESGFYHAIIEARAPIKERLRYEIIGQGDDRRCKVWATFRNEIEPRVFITEPLGKLRPPLNEHGQTKGSPLWVRKPEVQMFYDGSRDWARINCPDVLSGLYTREELLESGFEDAHVGPARAKDVTPASDLKLRLGADKPQRAADLREHVNAALDKQQSAADAGNASPADETAPAGVSTAGAEEAGASTSPPDPNASASTTSPTDQIGGAAPDNTLKKQSTEVGSAGDFARPADPPTEHALHDAFDRGVKDRANGKKRSNVPVEWREANPALAFEWIKGFNSVK